MFETITLDKLRLFLCVAEEGSFSAAGRRLKRVQSAVSQGIASLETDLGLALFDRSGLRPTLTDAGRALLVDAEQIFDHVATLRTKATKFSEGLESELSLVTDSITPASLLIPVVKKFQETFPTVSLRLRNEVMDSVLELVRCGECQIGLAGYAERNSDGLRRQLLTQISMVPVAAKRHRLSALSAPVATRSLVGETQIVVSQHSKAPGPDHGVLSASTWRVADMSTKRELIIAGLGWGSLPHELVAGDLEKGDLCELSLEEWGGRPSTVDLSVVARAGAVLGPAGQWLLGALQAAGEDAKR